MLSILFLHLKKEEIDKFLQFADNNDLSASVPLTKPQVDYLRSMEKIEDTFAANKETILRSMPDLNNSVCASKKNSYLHISDDTINQVTKVKNVLTKLS